MNTKIKRKFGLKVAIACPGVGLVQRGFERMFFDLFQVLKKDVDITLFKGGGAQSRSEKKMLFAGRNGVMTKIFPVHRLFNRQPMHSECMTFALSMLPYLNFGNYDLVHCIDPPLAKILYKLRHIFKLNFRLLYTEGTAMPATDYPPADHMHHISQVTRQRDIEFGLPPEYMTLIPIGIFPERFKAKLSRQALRKQYGIGQDTFVVLCVAALNRSHKRIDHLIDEVEPLDGDVLLLLDGSMDFGEPDLIPYAKERLGDRCIISHVKSECLADLYGLADIMVLPSVHEAFGIVIIEAASTGLPVLTHNGPHFQWLHPSSESLVNMKQKGLLRQTIKNYQHNRDKLHQLACPEIIKERFDWQYLKHQYIDLYHHVAD